MFVPVTGSPFATGSPAATAPPKKVQSEWISTFTICTPQLSNSSLIAHPGSKVKVAVLSNWGAKSRHTSTFRKAYPTGGKYNVTYHTTFKALPADADIIWLIFLDVKVKYDLAKLKKFLQEGKRIVMVGDHGDGWWTTRNARITKAVAALGGGIEVLKQAKRHNKMTLRNINKLQLTGGIPGFQNCYYAPLKVKASTTDVVVTDKWNGFVVADQILEKGRVTIIADGNFLEHHYGGTYNVPFLRNLAHQAAAFTKEAKKGKDPNDRAKKVKRAEGKCNCRGKCVHIRL